jgi:large subunit ribosomal protein L33
MAKIKGKFILVLLESLSGSGHQFAWKRLRLADKLEMYRFDPWVRDWVIYREKKKLKTLKD